MIEEEYAKGSDKNLCTEKYVISRVHSIYFYSGIPSIELNRTYRTQSNLVSSLPRVCNSGILLHANFYNLFLPVIQMLSVLLGRP